MKEYHTDLLSEEQIKGNAELFDQILGSIDPKSKPEKELHALMDGLHKTHFYVDPASSRPQYHSCFKGGLVVHSICNYQILNYLAHMPIFEPFMQATGVTDDELKIIGLLHDICKADTYKSVWKNQKTYDPAKVEAARKRHDRVQHDPAGDFIWECVQGYEWEDRRPMGHGEKSVDMVKDYMRLTPNEKYAIRYHMGFTEGSTPPYYTPNAAIAYRLHPVALLEYVADMAATYFFENEELLAMTRGKIPTEDIEKKYPEWRSIIVAQLAAAREH